MRNILFIVGVLLCASGLLVATGALKYDDTDKVIDIGSLEVEATREKTPPVNWGYVMLAGGALLLVGGAAMRKA